MVTGGRDYHPSPADAWALRAVLEWHRCSVLFHGDCDHRCADPACRRLSLDRWAGEVGRRRRLDVRARPADWDRFGLAAGPRRNAGMLDEAIAIGSAIVIAFPGGRGTLGTIQLARARGLEPVFVGRWHVIP